MVVKEDRRRSVSWSAHRETSCGEADGDHSADHATKWSSSL